LLTSGGCGHVHVHVRIPLAFESNYLSYEFMQRAFENPDLQGQEYQDFQDFKVRVIEEATEIFDIDSLREKLKAWTEEFWPRFRNVKQLKGRQYDETAHRRYISFKESFFAQMRNATPGPDLSELRREVTYLRQDLEEVRKENRSILPSVRLASAKGPTPRLASSASFTPFKKKPRGSGHFRRTNQAIITTRPKSTFSSTAVTPKGDAAARGASGQKTPGASRATPTPSQSSTGGRGPGRPANTHQGAAGSAREKTSVAPKRLVLPKDWTPEQTWAIADGIRQFGAGNWNKIIGKSALFKSLGFRNEDLLAKWEQMKRNKEMLREYVLSADGKGVPNFKPSNPRSAAMKTPQSKPQRPAPPQRKNLQMEMEEEEDSDDDEDGGRRR